MLRLPWGLVVAGFVIAMVWDRPRHRREQEQLRLLAQYRDELRELRGERRGVRRDDWDEMGHS